MEMNILVEEGVGICAPRIQDNPERVGWVEGVMEVKGWQLPRVEHLIRVEVEVGLGSQVLQMVSLVMVGRER